MPAFSQLPTATQSPSYYVCMRSFGRRGMEAVADPEITRDGVVARIKSGEWDRISFIHHIHDGRCIDVTSELIAEAASNEEAAA